MFPWCSAAPPTSWTSKCRCPSVRLAASRTVANASGSRSSRLSPSASRARNFSVSSRSSASDSPTKSSSRAFTCAARPSNRLRVRPSPARRSLSTIFTTLRLPSTHPRDPRRTSRRTSGTTIQGDRRCPRLHRRHSPTGRVAAANDHRKADPMDPASELPPPRAPDKADPMDPGPWAPTLTDGVVTLRAHRPDDVDAVVAQCRDPLMQRWTTVPVPYERSHAEEWLVSREHEWRQGTFLAFAVETDGLFCGSVDLRPDGERGASVGYGLGPWARGRGVLDRALRMLLPWGFEALDLEVVHWQAVAGNWASRRL